MKKAQGSEQMPQDVLWWMAVDGGRREQNV